MAVQGSPLAALAFATAVLTSREHWRRPAWWAAVALGALHMVPVAIGVLAVPHAARQSMGVAEADVAVEWVPGAFEVPFAARTLIRSGGFDAIIGLGCVIRGDTSHYDFVAGECARGLQDVELETGVPVIFGVLTTEDVEQALARSEPAGGHNVGEEGAHTAVEMATLVRRYPPA